MTLETKVAEVVVFAVRAATDPLAKRMADLEAHQAVPGPQGERGEKGADGLMGQPGPPGERGEKGLDGTPGVHGKDGRQGIGVAGGLITQDGHLALTLSDGTTHDVGPVVGPPGAKGADGLVAAPVPGLDAEVITTSADMLLRKELAALDAAAPPRMMKRIIRDARGKIERVIDEPSRG